MELAATTGSACYTLSPQTRIWLCNILPKGHTPRSYSLRDRKLMPKSRRIHAEPAETLIRVPLLWALHCSVFGEVTKSYSFRTDVHRCPPKLACGEVALYEFPTFRRQGTCPKELEVPYNSLHVYYPLLSSVKWTVLKCIKKRETCKHGSVAVALSRWGAVLCLNPNGNHKKVFPKCYTNANKARMRFAEPVKRLATLTSP